MYEAAFLFSANVSDMSYRKLIKKILTIKNGLTMALIVLVYVYAHTQSPKVVTVGGNNLCAGVLEGGDCDDKDVPKWTDPRLNSPSGRQEIFDDAVLRAFKKLGKVGEESWFNRFLYSYYIRHNENNDCTKSYVSSEIDFTTRRVKKLNYHVSPNIWNSCNSQLKVSINLSGVTRKENTAGASLPKIKRVTAEYRANYNTAEYYCGNELINRDRQRTDEFKNWDKTPLTSKTTPQILEIEEEAVCKSCQICYREELIVIIEVNQEIFRRGCLKIPTEAARNPLTGKVVIDPSTGMPKQRYARDPIEALIYIILHEIGHIEAFLSRESKCGLDYDMLLTEQDTTEGSAWEFASSVMNYKEDFNLQDVFEKSIKGMKNNYSDLRLENIETTNSFNIWSSTLPNIVIKGQEFKPEVWEHRTDKKHTGIMWEWQTDLSSECLEKQKTDLIIQEIKHTSVNFGIRNWRTRTTYEDDYELVIWEDNIENGSISIYTRKGTEKNTTAPKGKSNSIYILFLKEK